MTKVFWSRPSSLSNSRSSRNGLGLKVIWSDLAFISLVGTLEVLEHTIREGKVLDW